MKETFKFFAFWYVLWTCKELYSHSIPRTVHFIYLNHWLTEWATLFNQVEKSQFIYIIQCKKFSCYWNQFHFIESHCWIVQAYKIRTRQTASYFTGASRYTCVFSNNVPFVLVICRWFWAVGYFWEKLYVWTVFRLYLQSHSRLAPSVSFL